MSALQNPKKSFEWRTAALIALIVGAVAFSVMARLEDPASSSVIPAEDPYTHMGLVRGHLADGEIEPLVDGGTVYPPGMHAVLAAVHAFTGLDLYTIFLYGPIVFGALSVVGIALLLWRFAGPAAAVVGSLAAALAPELIFRTTMMAPTAVDLAVLPFLLLGALETLRGRLPWIGLVAASSLYLGVAHPWILTVMAPVALGTVILAFLFAGNVRREDRLNPMGASLVLATLGASLLAAIMICWSECGLGFHEIGHGTSGLDQVGVVAAGLALAAAAVLALARRPLRRFLDNLSGPMPLTVRAIMGVLAAGALLAVTIPAVQAGMPEHVDLPRMFGWPMLALGALGLVVTPFMRRQAAWAGVAMVTVTLPFVVHNPLDSPFWPHRTAAYLGIGIVILVGVAAAALFALAERALARLASTHQTPSRRVIHMVAGAGITAMVGLATAGSVYAATPPDYETGWYRLYQECEFDALRDVAESADAETVIIAGDWRPKLVAGAFADESRNVWYSESFFADPEHREETVAGLAMDGKRVVVVEDRHLILEHPELDRSFLQGDEWRPQGSHCQEGVAQARLNVYESEVRP